MSKVEENNYITHFNRELEVMRATVPEDDSLIIEPYVRSIIEVCKDFHKELHSSGSSPVATTVLTETLRAVLGLKILSPLLGEDKEWNDLEEGLFQNVRDSAVFKDGVQATYLNAIVWKGEEAWDTFTGVVEGIGSRQGIKEFPFMPRTFYIDVYREKYDENNPKHSKSLPLSTGEGDVVYLKS